jgi:hypothetical protein
MTDVVVVGGGSAGLSAAVAAARAGARVVLVERAASLGGMGSLALVHTICGLYRRGGEEPTFANDGFAREFAARLLDAGGARGPVSMGGLWVLPHDPREFAALADIIAAETPGLEVWREAELVGAESEDGRLGRVEVVTEGVRQVVCARAFVDATGDAALTALAGADFAQTEGARLQRPAFIVRLGDGPETGLDGEARLRLAHALAGAVRAGALPPEALGAAFRSGIKPGDVFLTLDLAAGGDGWNPAEPGALAAVEALGRSMAAAIVAFLARTAAGWERVEIRQWPARAGVRESRRVSGVYELRGDDVLNGAQFADGIAEIAWPLELREQATGPRWRHPTGEQPAQIPLRALRHRDVANLWVAGRCLSCDHEAQAAIRVMGTCFATGEAAGAAAALTANAAPDWNQLAARIRKGRAC